MIPLSPPAGGLRVVCVGAHPDDIEIGCGGTLLTLAERPGTTVAGLVLTGSGDRAVEAEKALPTFAGGATVEVVGLRDGRLPVQWDQTKEALEAFAREHPADLVLAPAVHDAHQDHRLLGTMVTTVWRDALVLHYEIPKWDGDQRSPTHYVPLADGVAHRKVALLRDSFASQAGRDWWDDEMFLGLMRLRGMECRSRYAEGFWTAKATLRLGPDQPGAAR